MQGVSLRTSLNWDDKILGRGVCLALLSEDENDLIALRYWLGMNNNNYYRDKYRILYKHCLENECIPQEVLENEELCKTLEIKRTLCERWLELKDELRNLENKGDIEKIDCLFPDKEPTKRINKIIKNIHEQDPLLKLKEILTEAIISFAEEKEESRIKIMTLHGAKGLTSHTVIMGGLVEGVLPSRDTAKLEEERRLMFVALTRAKSRIILSSFRMIKKGEASKLRLNIKDNGKYLSPPASNFLNELGPETPTTITGDKWLSSIGNN